MPAPILAAEAESGETSAGAIYEFILSLTEREGLATLAGNVVPPLLRVALILLAAAILNRVLRRVIKRSIRRLATEGGLSRIGALKHKGPLSDTTPMDIGRATLRAETISSVLRSITTISIWAMAVIMALGEFEISVGPLIAGAGIVGVALGFGAQKLVQDFLSGIFMLIEDQYGIGDIVDAGEAIGVIEGITLRTTRLRDLQGTVWHIPNGQIARIGNMSQEWARALLDVGVAYDTDVPKARDVIKRTADRLWRDAQWSSLVLDEPEVWGVEAFGDSEVTVRLVVKTVPGEQWRVARELRQRLKAAFDAEGIEIPFPQRTVWMRDDNGKAPAKVVPDRTAARSDQRRHEGTPRDYGEGSAMPDSDGGNL